MFNGNNSSVHLTLRKTLKSAFCHRLFKRVLNLHMLITSIELLWPCPIFKVTEEWKNDNNYIFQFWMWVDWGYVCCSSFPSFFCDMGPAGILQKSSSSARNVHVWVQPLCGLCELTSSSVKLACTSHVLHYKYNTIQTEIGCDRTFTDDAAIWYVGWWIVWNVTRTVHHYSVLCYVWNTQSPC